MDILQQTLDAAGELSDATCDLFERLVLVVVDANGGHGGLQVICDAVRAFERVAWQSCGC